MLEILTVCTGNVCRSPFAEMILRAELPGTRVTSAGSRALVDAPMEPDAVRMAAQYGIEESVLAAHRGRWLNESHLASPDLILAMSREHRRAVVELAPSRIRATFTAREFARLSRHLDDEEVRRTADAAGPDAGDRMRAVLLQLAGLRSEVEPPSDPTEDDVVDPYRRSWAVYEQMATELMPALGEVARIVRLTSP